MIKKETIKKHTESNCRRYMHMLEGGVSINEICRRYGINDKRLTVLWKRYQVEGMSGLKKRKNIKADLVLKKKIILDLEHNHLTLSAASLKYGASCSIIEVWLKTARTEGLSALKNKKRGRPKGMGKPRKTRRPLTELEKLQKENQELKTENALLKKVRALVDERNARLRAIGQKPSKN